METFWYRLTQVHVENGRKVFTLRICLPWIGCGGKWFGKTNVERIRQIAFSASDAADRGVRQRLSSAER